MKTLIVLVLISALGYASFGARDFMTVMKANHAERMEAALR